MMTKTLQPLVAAVSLSLLLSGCSSLLRTDYTPVNVDIPAQWQQQRVNADVSVDPWWQRFDDPHLNQLIERVLATNNDLAQATLTLQRARLQAGLSRDDLFPQLSSSTSTNRSKPLDGGDSSHSYSTGLSVSYEADLWGRLSATRDASDWAARASAEDRESTAQSLAATTATFYWQIAYLRQRIKLGQRSIDYAQKTLDLTRNQYDSGAVSRLDVLQATRSLASQRSTQLALEEQLTEARNGLAILFNQPPKQIDVGIDTLPTGDLPAITAGIPAEVLARRPDVKSALYTLRSQLASRDATLADYFPRLTLTGGASGASTSLTDLLRDPIGTLGASLTLPFLQWNRMQLNRDIADIDYQSAVISYRQTLYSAFEDVDNALASLNQYDAQRAPLKLAYASARESESIYEQQYRLGAVSVQDWLDAQENRRSAEETLLENRYNQLVGQATLYQALGGSDIAPSMDERGQQKTAPGKTGARLKNLATKVTSDSP